MDIIHTSISYGLQVSIGHADFWPNMGQVQPGCTFSLEVACSHMRVTKFYAESILSVRKFQSSSVCDSSFHWLMKYCECKQDCNSMGHYADLNKNGNFYLDTNSNTPYSKS